LGRLPLIVLDTHAWIWYAANDPRLTRRARAHIKRVEALGVHPISCWEVAMLTEHGRLRLAFDVSKVIW
jgi:PIN domain nuclease of toxin-antitoxin system